MPKQPCTWDTDIDGYGRPFLQHVTIRVSKNTIGHYWKLWSAPKQSAQHVSALAVSPRSSTSNSHSLWVAAGGQQHDTPDVMRGTVLLTSTRNIISHNILVLMWVLLSRVFYLSSHDMPDFHIASAISLAAAVAVKTMFKIFQNEWHAFQFACSGLTNVAILVTRRLSSLQQFNSHSYPNNKHCHFSILVSTARQSLWLKSLYEQNNTIKLTPMKIQLSVYACANIWGSNTVA